MKEPRQARSRETFDAILAAAAQVFERQGYAGATTNRIAERAGVSIGSLYQYFPNKDAILFALAERHLEQGNQLLAPLVVDFVADPPPVREGLELLFGAMVELHADSPRLHRVLFEECPRPAALQEQLDATYRIAVEAVEVWLSSRREVDVADPRLAAELVIQSVEGVTHGLVIHPRSGRKPTDYAAETVTLLSRYLCPRDRRGGG
ncbi:MAG: TetR/AcrR family transcriptional regulator [Solirubrobacterales bacterium]